jgi:hypothetical protein
MDQGNENRMDGRKCGMSFHEVFLSLHPGQWIYYSREAVIEITNYNIAFSKSNLGPLLLANPHEFSKD